MVMTTIANNGISMYGLPFVTVYRQYSLTKLGLLPIANSSQPALVLPDGEMYVAKGRQGPTKIMLHHTIKLKLTGPHRLYTGAQLVALHNHIIKLGQVRNITGGLKGKFTRPKSEKLFGLLSAVNYPSQIGTIVIGTKPTQHKIDTATSYGWKVVDGNDWLTKYSELLGYDIAEAFGCAII